ncbi:MAG: nucleotide exchange factor GrpE [Fimbriimonadaceae bacterium]|nr:nucleotide exchange factor GrpE [Chthonomonadaceae bacterium]MCO5295289.1 nucleotide exchange factor GrpE [Fimbriimonadaceae bacterium]
MPKKHSDTAKDSPPSKEAEGHLKSEGPTSDAQSESGATGGGGADETAAIEGLLARIAELEKQLEEERDQVVRSVAEFQNFRKRVQQEKVQLQKFAIETLVLDLLPVLDNFERTTAALQAGAAIESVAEGILAVERQLRGVLEGRHVTRVPAKGTAFDPELHEAVVTEESIWHPDGTVIEELEPGYKLGDRVVRPARVKVSRKP